MSVLDYFWGALEDDSRAFSFVRGLLAYSYLAIILILLNLGVFFGAALVGHMAYHARNLPMARWLYLLLASFCLVSLATLSVYALAEPEAKETFLALRYVGFALLTPSWILFLSANYGRWNWVRHPTTISFLFAPGAFTVLFSLIPDFRHLMIASVEPFAADGLQVLRFVTGHWFQIHFVWSLTLVFVSLIFLAQVAYRGNHVERKQVLLLSICTVIAVTIDAYCVATGSPLRWLMVSAGTYVLSEFALAYAGLRHRMFDPSPMAKEKIYLDFPDPVLVIDDERRLRSFNRASERLFGFDFRCLGQTPESLMPQLNLAAGEIRISTANHGVQFFDLKIEKLFHRGRYSGAIIYLREVTQRKEAEIELGRRLDFKARLMSLITHDLSNQVNGQARLSEELQRAVPEEIKGVADILASSIVSSRELMENLLAWARTQEDSFVPTVRPFELNTLLEDVVEDAQVVANQKAIQVRFRRAGYPLLLNGDSEMLACVFRNLLTNAVRASDRQTEIEVFHEAKDGGVQVIVKDHGRGMSDERVREVIRINSPQRPWFASVPAGGAEAQGTGLGLKLVYRFVDLHRGRVDILSVPGRGTRVEIFLPL